MGSVRKFGKFIIPFVFICICCLGISYARWTDQNIIQASINTEEMNYKLKTVSVEVYDGKCTDIFNKSKSKTIFKEININSGNKLEINVGDASEFLQKMQGIKKIVIKYTLVGSSNDNIALKSFNTSPIEYAFSLDKSSIECSYKGTPIAETAAAYLLPDTLGSFNVSNIFNGKTGSIILEKIPIEKDQEYKDHVLKYNDLPDELKNAINTVNASQVEKVNQNMNNQPDTNKNKKFEQTDLLLKANYSLVMDLNLDQYNTK